MVLLLLLLLFLLLLLLLLLRCTLMYKTCSLRIQSTVCFCEELYYYKNVCMETIGVNMGNEI